MKIKEIAPSSLENVKTILTKMNAKTKYADNGYVYASNVVDKISIADKAEFIDGRKFISRVPSGFGAQSESRLKIGNTELTIDNESGKIVEYSKSFFKSWNKVFKEIDKYLDMFSKNFDNALIVRQHNHSELGFTAKGVDEVEKVHKNVNNGSVKDFISCFHFNFYNCTK